MANTGGGRPERIIDWDLVDQMLRCQCTSEEIAAKFGIITETLSDKIFKKYGMRFLDYSTRFRSEGKGDLRMKQFQTALKGNVRLLEKLGEVYLDQGKDKSEACTIKDIGELVQAINATKPSMAE